jgi:hypothetical protein
MTETERKRLADELFDLRNKYGCGPTQEGPDALQRLEKAERALAEMQAQRDALAEAIDPFAKYGEQLRGQRVRLDTVMLELWGTKIVAEHLTQAHQALATLPASAARYRAVIEAAKERPPYEQIMKQGHAWHAIEKWYERMGVIVAGLGEDG